MDVKTWPGVLATPGDGLVFYADPNGTFAAADERQGKTLWHFPTRRKRGDAEMSLGAAGKSACATGLFKD